MKHIVITPEIANILERAAFAQNKLVLPEQLTRSDYVAVNKVIEALGGKWNRKAKGHIFPSDAGDLIATALENGFAENKRDILNQFYTPAALADYAASKLPPLPAGAKVLEPSAGHGALIAAVQRANPDTARMLAFTAIEIDVAAAEYLNDFVCADFLEWSPHNANQLFDAVIMNPPFSEQRDARHIIAAWKHVKAGGALVAICGAGITFRNTALAQFVRKLAQDFGSIEHLPDNSFAPQTNMNTALLVLQKPKAESV